MAAEIKSGAGFAFDPPKELFLSNYSALDLTPDGKQFLVVKSERERKREPLEVVLHWREAFTK